MRFLRYLVPAAMLLAGYNLLRADDRPPAADRARQVEAIHRLQLQQRYDARQQQIRALSHLQARHHELQMQIINNMRPTGRYVYNPATGKYDRHVTD